LVSSLIDTLYQDLRSIIVGKKYDSGTLGYYNRGKNFPQFIISAVSGTVQSVILPAMSAEQDEVLKVKNLTRASISVSAYILFPLMAGLAAVAAPMVQVLLTDKWLPCVPYLQIYCFNLAFTPVHMCNLQAINAMGRSDIFLRLEIIKKSIGILALAVAVFFFDSPIAIALTGVFTVFTSCFINAFPNKKLIGYSYFEQLRDLLPSLLAAGIMLILTHSLMLLQLGSMVTLLLQIPTGIVVYILLSMLLKIPAFKTVLSLIRK
jgi:O-antigen/teichoic acid export membrane protein